MLDMQEHISPIFCISHCVTCCCWIWFTGERTNELGAITWECLTQDGAVASEILSQNGTYGFTSSTGDPSTTSAPDSSRFPPSLPTIRAMLIPAHISGTHKHLYLPSSPMNMQHSLAYDLGCQTGNLEQYPRSLDPVSVPTGACLQPSRKDKVISQQFPRQSSIAFTPRTIGLGNLVNQTLHCREEVTKHWDCTGHGMGSVMMNGANEKHPFNHTARGQCNLLTIPIKWYQR